MPVVQVLVDGQRAVGVRLADGNEIPAECVVSAADPKRTLLGLVGSPELPPEFVWQAQSVKLRGSVAKIHWLTDGKHGLPVGTLVVAPTLRHLERAYDASKYGEISADPYLDITIPSLADPSLAPSGGHVMSVYVQFAPRTLAGGRSSRLGLGTRRTPASQPSPPTSIGVGFNSGPGAACDSAAPGT